MSSLYGQTCVPARILPTGSTSGRLDATSCLLSDATAYAAYRLDLPVRGQIQIDLDPGQADLILIVRDSSGSAIASGASIHRPIEAGSYSLLVDGRTPGQAGPYTVQTAFTAEPGMLCAGYSRLGLNQTTVGTLFASGCVAPDGTPVEAYTVTTFGAGTLTVSVASAAFTPWLMVRDGDARPLASGPKTVSLPVDAASQYQVAVATADTAGVYQLTTSFQPAAGETCLAQRNFSGSAQDAGTISAASCAETIDGSGDQAYYSYYNLTVSGAGLAVLAADSGDFNPTVVLLDSDGNTLATDSDGYLLSTGLAHAEIRQQLSPGYYTVLVYSDIAAGGNYTLQYTFTSGPPIPCASTTPSASVNATLSPASCRTSLGISDVYNLVLNTAGTVDINVSSSDFVPEVAIRDAKENLVVLGRDQSGLGISHIAADLPAGAYSIVAAAISGLGNYQIATSFIAHDINPCAYPFPVPLNGTYYQNLGSFNCTGANGQPEDLFRFTLPTDGVIASVVASSDIDGYLTLLDSAGNVLRSDDNTYGNNDPIVVQFLPAGTYQLAVRDAASSSGGPYALALYVALGPRPPFCAPRAQLPVGGSVSGNINSAGCQYGDTTLADIYRVDLTSDSTIDLRLNSSEFDAYLVLLDAKGNLIDQDDDSGGGTNARINRAVKAGTYFVAAKPFSDYFSQGNYTLSLAGSY